jgi:C4-dicarboxylate transporter
MSGIFNIKRRLLVGGPILVVVGLAVYLVKGAQLALVLPVIGVVLLILGVLYKPKPKKKPELIND